MELTLTWDKFRVPTEAEIIDHVPIRMLERLSEYGGLCRSSNSSTTRASLSGLVFEILDLSAETLSCDPEGLQARKNVKQRWRFQDDERERLLSIDAAEFALSWSKAFAVPVKITLVAGDVVFDAHAFSIVDKGENGTIVYFKKETLPLDVLKDKKNHVGEMLLERFSETNALPALKRKRTPMPEQNWIYKGDLLVTDVSSKTISLQTCFVTQITSVVTDKEAPTGEKLEPPTDEPPTDEAPTDEKLEPLTDEAPTDEAPTGEKPEPLTDEAPADEAPTDEAPTDERDAPSVPPNSPVGFVC